MENNKDSLRRTQVDAVARGPERSDAYTSLQIARSHSHLLKTTTSSPGACWQKFPAWFFFSVHGVSAPIVTDSSYHRE